MGAREKAEDRFGRAGGRGGHLADRYGERMSIATLDLDLDLFSGPFDLLLTLILREEVDLLELQLADVVLAYLDHLETPGELDLETATEFIVLIAALLELKSRLMLSGSEEDELLDIEPAQAAEELLARMLEARRYRAAAAHLGELSKSEEGVRFRQAPLPASLRRTITAAGGAALRTLSSWARRSGGCCRCRRRSACATSACRGSRSPSASRTCAACSDAGASASTRR